MTQTQVKLLSKPRFPHFICIVRFDFLPNLSSTPPLLKIPGSAPGRTWTWEIGQTGHKPTRPNPFTSPAIANNYQPGHAHTQTSYCSGPGMLLLLLLVTPDRP